MIVLARMSATPLLASGSKKRFTSLFLPTARSRYTLRTLTGHLDLAHLVRGRADGCLSANSALRGCLPGRSRSVGAEVEGVGFGDDHDHRNLHSLSAA